MRLWRDELTVAPGFIRRAAVFCAVRSGEVVGFYALSGSGAELELEHMWVDPAQLRGGIGAALFAHALTTARRRRGCRLLIAADPHAEGFYRRLGARRIGEVASRPRGRRLPLLAIGVADESQPVRRRPAVRVGGASTRRR